MEFIPNSGPDSYLGGNRGANLGIRLNPQDPQGFIYYHYLSFKKIVCKKTENGIVPVGGGQRI